MSILKQFGEVKSAPYIELNTVIAKRSNESNSTLSYKSCGDIEDFHHKSVNVIVENSPSVKALIKKLNNNATNTNFNVTNQKSYEIKDFRINSTETESLDSTKKSLDTDGDFENTEQSFEVNKQSGLLVNNDTCEIIKHEDKTTVLDLSVTDEQLWHNILQIMYTNQAYSLCLKNIADAEKFQKLEDIIVYASTVLKSVNKLECDEREWIIACAKQILNGQSIDKEQCTQLPYSTYPRFSAVQYELEESKQHVNRLKIRMAMLRKEKRDLLNIIKSYDSERVNKLSLEKRLQAEQMKNDELRAIISSVYDKKVQAVFL